MRFYLFGLFLLVSATTAHAAGFAKDTLFLSQTPVVEGEAVLIHTVVANESTQPFKGTVVFKDGEEHIGTVGVGIAPGGANTVSVSWKPSAGSHNVTADLTNEDGTVAEEQSATFHIDAKPEQQTQPAAAVESSDELQKKLNGISPTAADISAPIFSTLDSARSKAADLLDAGLEWTQEKGGGKNPGEVLGEATQDTSAGGIAHTAWTILATVVYYILSLLRFIVGTAGIFYPVFAILFFYTMWRLYKRMRRGY